jgi:hypothetical protein
MVKQYFFSSVTLLVLMFVFIHAGFGQSGPVTGVVTESDSRQTLPELQFLLKVQPQVLSQISTVGLRCR